MRPLRVIFLSSRARLGGNETRTRRSRPNRRESGSERSRRIHVFRIANKQTQKSRARRRRRRIIRSVWFHAVEKSATRSGRKVSAPTGRRFQSYRTRTERTAS